MARNLPRSLKSKVVWSVLLCLLALGIGVGGFLGLAALKTPPEVRSQVEKPYNVEVFDVSRGDLQEIISGFGTARADREVVLSAQVAGEVVDVHPQLEVGHEVRTADVTVGSSGESVRFDGDLLARIDPRLYEERVAQLRNLLAEDDAELQQLKQEQANNARMLEQVQEDLRTFTEEYERIKKLGQNDTVSKSLITRTLLELRQYEEKLLDRQNLAKLFPLRLSLAEKRRQTHQSDLELAQLDLQHTELRPPFSGVLSEIQVEQGQYARVGDPMVRLVDLSRVEVPVSIPLDDYAKLKPEVQAGRFPHVVLAENETARGRWTGRVVRVAPQADQLTRTVNVFVEVENRQQPVPLLPGTFVHARIDGPVLTEVIVVPRDAIVNGKLFIAVGGRAARRIPDVRRTLQSLAVVDFGLESGDQVILTNLDVVHEGAQINIQGRRTLSDEIKKQRVQVARESLAGGSSEHDGS